MLKSLMATTDSVLDTCLRIILAVVFFPHGAQKVLGLFGGPGLGGTMTLFTQQMGIPTVFAALAIAAEFLGSIGLFVGFLARVAAFGLFCVMAVAVAMAHWHVGFFMNWAGQYPPGKEGFEFHLLAMALLIAVMVRGAGWLSVDRALSRKRRW